MHLCRYSVSRTSPYHTHLAPRALTIGYNLFRPLLRGLLLLPFAHHPPHKPLLPNPLSPRIYPLHEQPCTIIGRPWLAFHHSSTGLAHTAPIKRSIFSSPITHPCRTDTAISIVPPSHFKLVPDRRLLEDGREGRWLAEPRDIIHVILW